MLFQCHRITASRIFTIVLDVLYYRFKNFISWSSNETLTKNMPKCFADVFGSNVTVIIDYFEVFIERPSNIEAAAKTWSDYKHHQTVKFLIGISPQDFIMFISNAYGGRASDKFIVEDITFLESLNQGDLIIADRGFSIDERLYCARVKYPTFLRGRKQMSPEDIESTRKLTSVRIHIERIIRQLKGKYRIFKTPFPIQQLQKIDQDISLIDKIINVCCCFVNWCPPIIPMY